MIGDSKRARIFAAVASLLLTAVAPLAFAHHFLHLFYKSPFLSYVSPPTSSTWPAFLLGIPFTLQAFLHYWLGIEILFYVYFLVTHHLLQQPTNYVPLTEHERTILFQRCIEETDNLEIFLSGWFQRRGQPSVLQSHKTRDVSSSDGSSRTLVGDGTVQLEDIYRGNLIEWLAWAFFNKTFIDARTDKHLSDQLDQMTDYMEDKKQHHFPLGYNPSLRCTRFSFDPVKAVHRPFFFYVVIFALDYTGKALLRLAGFRRYGREPRNPILFVGSLIANYYGISTSSDYSCNRTTLERMPKVTYWYWPGDSNNNNNNNDSRINDTKSRQRVSSTGEPHPIVFTHGIGAGLALYLKFIYKFFCSTDRRTPIYLVELPYISMRFHTQVPTVPETVQEIEAALNEHGHRHAVFVGHSLGSIVVAGMCRLARKRVAGVVLVDPICFLLHHPAVTWRFLHRVPVRANEKFVFFLASRELFISRYISRSFHWYHSCMWADDMPKNSVVYLSDYDLLVPSPEVGKYLKREGVACHSMPLDHAQFMMDGHWEDKIVESITLMITSTTTRCQ